MSQHEVCKILSAAINSSGLTKQEIAQRANMSRQTLYSIINGSDPKLSTVMSLASILKLKIYIR